MPVSLGPYVESPNQKKQAFLKRFGIIAGFILLLGLLAGNTLFVRRQLGVQLEAQSGVTHTRQVLFALERTEPLLKDAETGQRGFLYTGEPKYLEPYNLAVTQIKPNMDAVAALTADNPHQQSRISELRNLAAARLAELDKTISIYQSGSPDEAKTLVKSDAGKATMDAIRKLVADMEQEEYSLQVIRSAALQRSIRATIVSVYLPSLFGAAGLILLGYLILLEMSHRERFLHEIRRREEWYRVTLTAIGDAVIATNEHGIVTFLNPAAETLTGTTMAQAIGKDIAVVFPIVNEVTHEAAENPVKRVMELGRVVGLANHTALKGKDGTLIPIEDSAAPIHDDRGKLVGVVLNFRDMTHERKAHEVLYKTERLAAAARLSATVAHEINNPLEAVVNLVFLAKSASDAPTLVVQSLAMAEQELERVAHITRQTLGFFRDSNSPELIEMPALVESVLKLYSNKLQKKNIAVTRDFCQCPPVLGLPGELKQVISNLVSNAADAVGSGGTITLRTGCVDEPDGKALHLEIEDDGPGIAAENMERIFEPFFTTKKDVGTGLGLWISKEIVERHGGKIHAASLDNGAHGAVFSILLPCSSEVALPSVVH